MILGFDIDEVVCLLMDKVEYYLKETYGIDFDPEKLTTFSLKSSPDIGNNKEVLEDLKNKFSDPSLGFYIDCLPDKAGVDVIKKLKRAGHLIYFISGRPAGAEAKTALWLRKNKIPFNYIKHVGHHKKGVVCRNLKLDFYIDDNAESIEDILEHKKPWARGLAVLDKPWNRYYNNEKVIRIKTWHDVLRKIGV